jgi:hypothetical protein
MSRAQIPRPAAAPGFLEGVAVAAIASLSGGALLALTGLLLAPTLGPALARTATVAIVGLGYLTYLAWRSPVAAGRMILPLTAGAVSTGTLLLAPVWLLPTQLSVLWLTRVLLHQRGLLAALLDLALILLGLGAGLWAIAATGSTAAALWSFFLVQALFPILRGLPGRVPLDSAPAVDGDDRFDRAARSAASSLRRLSAILNGR